MALVAQDEKSKQLAADEALAALGFNLKEYDLFLYIKMCRNVFQLHEMTGMMGGKILRAIKEKESHGTFGKALGEIGIQPRQAQRYMHLSKRFGKYDKLSHLSNSKLDIIDALTDPEIEKLLDGEEVKGLTMDAIESLPASQARDRLRAAEKKLEDQKKRHEQTVKEMSAELETLRLRDGVLPPPTKEQKAAAALEELRKKLFAEIQLTRFHFGECLKVISAAEKVEGVTFPLLERWAKEEYEELAGFQSMLEELDEALQYVSPDKGGGNAN